ncbi:glutaredoxin family protein [Nocardioidaceae bacterium]|nr:glutaredoxin family protein [Nocardioidaceae bacterium]
MTRHGPEPVRVRVLTRVGCHLCETAEQVVATVCAEQGVGWEAVDIDRAPDADDLLDEHGEEIPVTFVDGVLHDYWRVDPSRLAAALGR